MITAGRDVNAYVQEMSVSKINFEQCTHLFNYLPNSCLITKAGTSGLLF